ncbi:haloacid dehalogenase [Dokdonia pacifica]|uniref:Putative hydrolase of the HAD superfamily n=1 Tax=Dokdonia pacifica TaxID=1627892 RepID=A0A239DEF4_9FLAO|nr:HAD family hydrolase [Dokdonia pacifica]GGG39777.1 haloacid dehalogenase [Dokdonia pacifica]SNS30707.1 putative hydrolase of the HAD superfamily [Dokdonia pacifica]
MNATIQAIAFDADDTLWVNETFFRDAEDQFCALFKDYVSYEECQKLLFNMEMHNLPMYGYGIKPFTLSLIEAAIEITNNKVSISQISELIALGKSMLEAPVVLIDGIEEVLGTLSRKHKLVVATKGDLLDQERKLEKSGLAKYFHHIEVMSDKQPKNYTKLVNHLDISPQEFLMIGNSLKSDILPVLEIGGSAFHIPFHTTWLHEQVEEVVAHENFKELSNASEILEWV